MLVSTGDHFGGRPRRIAPVSMNMPLHAGQRHALERRRCGCMTVPSFGHFHAVCAWSAIVSPSVRLDRPFRRYAPARVVDSPQPRSLSLTKQPVAIATLVAIAVSVTSNMKC